MVFHSIGSLGKDNSTAAVIGVVLDDAVLTGTANGVRIKTWQVTNAQRAATLLQTKPKHSAKEEALFEKEEESKWLVHRPYLLHQPDKLADKSLNLDVA